MISHFAFRISHFVFFLLLVAPAWAADVSPLFKDAPRDNAWEPLLVTVDRPGIVYLRDARGGLQIGRTSDSGEKRPLLLSLPLLAAEQSVDQSGLRWKLQFRIARDDADAATPWTSVDITRPAPAATSTMRLLIPAGAEPDAKDLAVLGNVVTAPLPESEILNAPPMAFAGCDALLLDARLARALTTERANALFACGVRLVYIGPASPPGLPGITWAALPDSPLRVAPVEWAALAPPRVIEPDLPKLRPEVVRPPPGLVLTMVALTPALIGLVLFVRAITARAGVICLILALCLTAATPLLLLSIRGTMEPVAQVAAWQTRRAPGSINVLERLELHSALRAAVLDLSVPTPGSFVPVEPTPQRWLSRNDERLLLDASVALGQKTLRFRGPLEARRPRAFMVRSVSSEWPLPASPADELWARHRADHQIDLARGWWVDNGKVTLAGMPGLPVPFDQWRRTQPPAAQLALQAWFELRLRGPTRYHLQLRESEAASTLQVVEFPSP